MVYAMHEPAKDPKADPDYHPVPAALADSVGYLLYRAHVRAQGVATQKLPAGSHPRDYAVLEMLDSLEFGSQQELAEALCVNRTIMVGIVDELERAGYVERQRDPSDRRRYLLDLTGEGRAHLDVLRAAAPAGDRLFTAALSADEVAELNDLLRPIALQRLTEEVTDDLLELTAFLTVHSHFQLLQLAVPQLAELSLQPRHLGLLRVLDDLGPVSQQRAAEEMQVGPATVVEIVDGLEQAGLVKRRVSATDRRTNDLVVTAKGRHALTRAVTIQENVENEASRDIGPAGRRRLVALLGKVVTGKY